MIPRVLMLGGMFALASAALADPPILKQEPPSGSLSHGQVVLIDDGSCPEGQIKEVLTRGSKT
jgi:hypothetical protein